SRAAPPVLRLRGRGLRSISGGSPPTVGQAPRGKPAGRDPDPRVDRSFDREPRAAVPQGNPAIPPPGARRRALLVGGDAAGLGGCPAVAHPRLPSPRRLLRPWVPKSRRGVPRSRRGRESRPDH